MTKQQHYLLVSGFGSDTRTYLHAWLQGNVMMFFCYLVSNNIQMLQLLPAVDE